VGDPDVEEGGLAPDVDSGSSNRRGRGVFAAVVLLLLTLCAVTTITQTYVTAGDETVIKSVTENLECLQCHVELIPEFSRDWVHNPFASERCTTCHTPHGKIETTTIIAGVQQAWNRMVTLVEWLPLKVVLDVFGGDDQLAEDPGGAVKSTTEKQVKDRESSLVMPQSELCWMCHGDMGWQRNAEYAHSPFVNGLCTDCHNPHASDHRIMLVVAVEDLCIRCHPIGRELNRAQSHAPVAGLHCTNCHDPHGSLYKGILVDNQRDLCFTCHPSVARLSSMGVQHRPYLEDACTDCHEPHGSDYLPLLRRPQPSLCYSCHPQISEDFKKVSHHPVGTFSLNCTGCHDAHATNYDGLLRNEGNGICYDCHRVPIQASYDRSAHFGTPCWGCHMPHGSDYGPLLIAPQPTVCFPCHDRSHYDDATGGARNRHPVRPVFFDVHSNRPLTCTSSCHNPHGTQYQMMLQHYEWSEDGNRLICHGVIPGRIVGVDF
jgi:predicted CXXCH cytochrome family protein